MRFTVTAEFALEADDADEAVTAIDSLCNNAISSFDEYEYLGADVESDDHPAVTAPSRVNFQRTAPADLVAGDVFEIDGYRRTVREVYRHADLGYWHVGIEAAPLSMVFADTDVLDVVKED